MPKRPGNPTVDPEAFQCPLCSEMAWNLLILPCKRPEGSLSRHKICINCVHKTKEGLFVKCPFHCEMARKVSPKNLKVDHSYAEMVKRVKVDCPHGDCQWSGSMPAFAIHTDSFQCDFMVRECPGCKVKMTGSDLKEHLENEDGFKSDIIAIALEMTGLIAEIEEKDTQCRVDGLADAMRRKGVMAYEAADFIRILSDKTITMYLELEKMARKDSTIVYEKESKNFKIPDTLSEALQRVQQKVVNIMAIMTDPDSDMGPTEERYEFWPFHLRRFLKMGKDLLSILQYSIKTWNYCEGLAKPDVLAGEEILGVDEETASGLPFRISKWRERINEMISISKKQVHPTEIFENEILPHVVSMATKANWLDYILKPANAEMLSDWRPLLQGVSGKLPEFEGSDTSEINLQWAEEERSICVQWEITGNLMLLQMQDILQKLTYVFKQLLFSTRSPRHPAAVMAEEDKEELEKFVTKVYNTLPMNKLMKSSPFNFEMSNDSVLLDMIVDFMRFKMGIPEREEFKQSAGHLILSDDAKRDLLESEIAGYDITLEALCKEIRKAALEILSRPADVGEMGFRATSEEIGDELAEAMEEEEQTGHVLALRVTEALLGEGSD